MRSIDLTSTTSFSTVPFPHLHGENAVAEQFASSLLRWFATSAPWQLKIADFYEQYEFSLLDTNVPSDLVELVFPDSVRELINRLEIAFDAKLSKDRWDATAHKLKDRQSIRIHNDFIPSQETHRLLIQVNSTWSEDDGGFLMLFAGPKPEHVARLVRPYHRSILAFEISEHSFHAVTPVTLGDRYTLVYSFYGR